MVRGPDVAATKHTDPPAPDEMQPPWAPRGTNAARHPKMTYGARLPRDSWHGRRMDERPSYKRPDWFTSHVFNPLVAGLTRSGVSLLGSRVLRVRGRKTGTWRETPVNLLKLDDTEYLVAARGETQWVRNLRARGEGELRVGRRTQVFSAQEVSDDEKSAVLRAYLKRWRWEIGAFFEGVSPDSSEEDLMAEARHHPVFRLH